jgi:hypothetical protein
LFLLEFFSAASPGFELVSPDHTYHFIERSTVGRDRKGPESCPTTRTGFVLVYLANQKIGPNLQQNQYLNLPSGRIPEEEGVTENASSNGMYNQATKRLDLAGGFLFAYKE